MLYGCIHTDGSSAKACATVQVALNKVLHAVMSADGRYSTNVLHTKLQVPYVSDIHKYHLSCMTYKDLHHIGPPNINEMYHVANRNMGLHSKDTINMSIGHCMTAVEA